MSTVGGQLRRRIFRSLLIRKPPCSRASDSVGLFIPAVFGKCLPPGSRPSPSGSPRFPRIVVEPARKKVRPRASRIGIGFLLNNFYRSRAKCR